MTAVAALLAGLGGLLLEMVLLRRHGLLLGNTAEAAALVLALFLAGLGVGGLLVARLRGHPGRTAAALYGSVALSAPLLDALLRQLEAVPWLTGLALAVLAPGLLAVAMGAGFPLLFALQPATPWRCGGLVGANLAGSVVAAWVGGNVWIPELGLTTTLWIGAGAYAAAAGLLVWRRHGAEPLRPGRPLPFTLGARPALAAGALGIGYEILLLRRLPFWLEGLQPTLSGVLAACLFGFTAGSLLGTGWLQRVLGRRAAFNALAAAAVAICAGIHELWVPPLSRLVIGSPELSAPLLRDGDVGLHLRILLASLAAAALPCFLLGAVVPLLLARLRHRDSRPALAGRLFFWNGVGGLLGSLWVGKLVPALAPEAYFVAAPTSLALGCLLLCLRRGGWPVAAAAGYAVAAALGVSFTGSVLAPSSPIAGSRYDRPLSYRYVAHRSDSALTASVVYDRRRHSMLLFTDGFRAAETGPGTAYMKALGHLPMLLRDDLERVAVIALGTGTTADAVVTWPAPREIHVVEISPAVLSLVDHFAGDGPGESGRTTPRFVADRRTEMHLADGRRFLARRPAGSLDLITIEPLLPYAPGTGPLYTAEGLRAARRGTPALAPRGGREA